jgi:hypothetical protein
MADVVDSEKTIDAIRRSMPFRMLGKSVKKFGGKKTKSP